ANRPGPTWPLARRPDSGSTKVTPRRRSVARLSWTAGFDHMASFIAGATTTGQRAASSVAVTMSSERPVAILPITLAVAGTRRMSCAQSPRETCGSGEPSAAHSPVGGALDIVVGDDVVVLRSVGHLALGDLAPGGAVLRRIAAPLLLPPDQLLLRGRDDEDQDRVGHQATHLVRALDVDLQHHVAARV